MRNILNHFKFHSVEKANRLNRHPIFCYDFIIGLAMLMLMTNVLTLLSIHKPLLLFGLTCYSFVLLFPIGLTLSSIMASVYGFAIARNILWWLSSFLLLFGFLTTVVDYIPASAPAFLQNEGAFSYVFHDTLLIALCYAILIFVTYSLHYGLLVHLKGRVSQKYPAFGELSAACVTHLIAFMSFYLLCTFLPILAIHPPWLRLLLMQLVIGVLLWFIAQIVIPWLQKKEAIGTVEATKHYHWFKCAIVEKKLLRQLRVINNTSNRHLPLFRYNYLLGLVMAYMFFMLLSGMLVFRLADLHFLVLPIGIFLPPLIYSTSNITTEVYGYAVARNMMWWFIMTSAVFTLLSALLAAIPSTPNFQHNRGYQLMLGSMPVVFIAGILGTIGGITVNNAVVSKLKKKFAGYHYWLRAILSTAGGEVVYNCIAYPIMYFSKMNLHHFLLVFFSVSLFKLAATAIIWPTECYIASRLKLGEKVNVFDYDVNYRIFRFSTKQPKIANQ